MNNQHHPKPTRWPLTIALTVAILIGIWAALPLLQLILFSGAFALAVKLTGILAIVIYDRIARSRDT